MPNTIARNCTWIGGFGNSLTSDWIFCRPIVRTEPHRTGLETHLTTVPSQPLLRVPRQRRRCRRNAVRGMDQANDTLRRLCAFTYTMFSCLGGCEQQTLLAGSAARTHSGSPVFTNRPVPGVREGPLKGGQQRKGSPENLRREAREPEPKTDVIGSPAGAVRELPCLHLSAQWTHRLLAHRAKSVSDWHGDSWAEGPGKGILLPTQEMGSRVPAPNAR